MTVRRTPTIAKILIIIIIIRIRKTTQGIRRMAMGGSGTASAGGTTTGLLGAVSATEDTCCTSAQSTPGMSPLP
jgi:hypothetical protein